MAVAGIGTTLIARTGQHATVTPFSKSLPVMNKVEIVDVAMAYDGPFTLKTYLFVMRNAVYIPTMGHNLMPPIILRKAGLHVDKTPKTQAVNPAITNHSIFDPVTGLRVHLQLNGIFSHFITRPLAMDEESHWECYPIIFLAPDAEL
jgi:hypothetical protein